MMLMKLELIKSIVNDYTMYIVYAMENRVFLYDNGKTNTMTLSEYENLKSKGEN
ncbi:hypothetical protein [Clostridium butyricum]|uniref:hypothetical protein n=3 Tax=Clostridium butyricum TaxID=1492 RepID=UPI002ABE4EB7|nr:hypothetical protein [Clostridium butyricum]